MKNNKSKVLNLTNVKLFYTFYSRSFGVIFLFTSFLVLANQTMAKAILHTVENVNLNSVLLAENNDEIKVKHHKITQSLNDIYSFELENNKPSGASLSALFSKDYLFELENSLHINALDTTSMYKKLEVKHQIENIKSTSKNSISLEDSIDIYTAYHQLNNSFSFLVVHKIQDLMRLEENSKQVEKLLRLTDQCKKQNILISAALLKFKDRYDKKMEVINIQQSRLLFIIFFICVLLYFGYDRIKQMRKLNNINLLLNLKNIEVEDSIKYAQRIQQAILPTIASIQAAFNDSFVLFKPKDIVSGDFYWFQQIVTKKYLAVCDCTGHGVPGALMSMVATDMLNDALVHKSGVDGFLAHTNLIMKSALKQTNHFESTRDGMDLLLICLDENNKLSFSGAYRPLLLIKKDATEINVYKTTKAAIGGLTADNQTFATEEIQLQPGDSIYLFTDGYADQFNEGNKKLMSKRFKEILLRIQHLSMDEQGKYLDQYITEWAGSAEQTDDVLVVGVRV